MRIEFIYTYNDEPQEIVSYPFVLPILQDKKTLVKYALTDLSDKEKQQLVKISTCIYLENECKVELPEWFNECDGKLYFKMGVEISLYDASMVKCDVCNNKWVSVRPKGTEKLECPNCSIIGYFENMECE